MSLQKSQAPRGTCSCTCYESWPKVCSPNPQDKLTGHGSPQIRESLLASGAQKQPHQLLQL